MMLSTVFISWKNRTNKDFNERGKIRSKPIYTIWNTKSSDGVYDYILNPSII